MARQFEIAFVNGDATLIADLLWDEAPITCENFWNVLPADGTIFEKLHHGGETGPEIWCFVPPPAEELPYENATVFPEHGDILYYHYRQPPTRDGKMVYDIGIYWDRGQSKLKQGWIPGNLFARIRGAEQLKQLRVEAGRLLMEGGGMVVLRRKG
ncbi:MAG: DUF3830 family protein [Planctomycetota bacterium]|jgi:hypothetical protein